MSEPTPSSPRAVLDALLFAAYDASLRTAHGALAASVQQRLTTAGRLQEWLERLRPLRHAGSFRLALADIDGGAHSRAELDVRRMCRAYAMPLPARQVRRRDREGKQRATDCEWHLGEHVVVLEVEGAFHIDVRHATADARRQRKLTSRTRLMVRCSAYELRHEPATVAVDLIALGVPGRVPHDAP